MRGNLAVLGAVLVLGAAPAGQGIPVHDPARFQQLADELRQIRRFIDLSVQNAKQLQDMNRPSPPLLSALRGPDRTAAMHDAAKMPYASAYLDALNGTRPVSAIPPLSKQFDYLNFAVRLLKLPPDVRTTEIIKLATTEAMDSVVNVGIQTAANARRFDAQMSTRIAMLERERSRLRTVEGLTQRADHLSVGSALGLHQKQMVTQVDMAILEQLILKNKAARDDDAIVANMRTNQTLHGRESSRRLTNGMTRDLKNWKLP